MEDLAYEVHYEDGLLKVSDKFVAVMLGTRFEHVENMIVALTTHMNSVVENGHLKQTYF